MKRREIIKYTAFLTGAAVSAPIASSILSGCAHEAASGGIGDGLHFFDDDGFSLLTKLVDIILPKTDSPSASEVGVHNTIDAIVGKAYDGEAQSLYRDGFTALSGHLRDRDDILAVFKDLEKSEESSLKDVKSAYKNLKQQTIAYYLSTEEIGTKFLNYLPVPGEYKACVSLDEVGGKAWAI